MKIKTVHGEILDVEYGSLEYAMIMKQIRWKREMLQ